jgi:hypothetical protein
MPEENKQACCNAYVSVKAACTPSANNADQVNLVQH